MDVLILTLIGACAGLALLGVGLLVYQGRPVRLEKLVNELGRDVGTAVQAVNAVNEERLRWRAEHNRMIEELETWFDRLERKRNSAQGASSRAERKAQNEQAAAQQRLESLSPQDRRTAIIDEARARARGEVA